jgi:hypothetical protein
MEVGLVGAGVSCRPDWCKGFTTSYQSKLSPRQGSVAAEDLASYFGIDPKLPKGSPVGVGSGAEQAELDQVISTRYGDLAKNFTTAFDSRYWLPSPSSSLDAIFRLRVGRTTVWQE